MVIKCIPKIAPKISDRKSARTRFDAIAPLVELSEIPIARRFPHLMADGQRMLTWSQAVEWCADRSGVSARSIYRMHAAFKKGGQKALQRSDRRDKGVSRFFTRHEKAALFAAYLHLAYPGNLCAVHSAIARDAGLLDIPEGKTPSYETVRTWLRSTLQSTLVTLALKGQRIFREQVAQHAKRGHLGA